ncbi:unnamed protein product [Urochloa humidicola]
MVPFHGRENRRRRPNPQAEEIDAAIVAYGPIPVWKGEAASMAILLMRDVLPLSLLFLLSRLFINNIQCWIRYKEVEH